MVGELKTVMEHTSLCSFTLFHFYCTKSVSKQNTFSRTSSKHYGNLSTKTVVTVDALFP